MPTKTRQRIGEPVYITRLGAQLIRDAYQDAILHMAVREFWGFAGLYLEARESKGERHPTTKMMRKSMKLQLDFYKRHCAEKNLLRVKKTSL